MNINRIQSQLQRVPDQALIGYVQNPDGQVPSFLALAELTRRKEIRNAGQAQQAPTQSIADQVVGEGVSALPLPETMFNEESYANGGIVSFEEGGEVQRFTEGGRPFVELTNAQLSQLSPAEKRAYIARKNENANKQTNLLKRNMGFSVERDTAAPDINTLLGQRARPAESYLDNLPSSDKFSSINPEASTPNPAALTQPNPNPGGPALSNINYGLPNAFANMNVPERPSLDRDIFVGDKPTMSGIQSLRKDVYKEAGVSEDAYDKVMQDIKTRRGDVEGKGKDRALGEFLMNLGFGAAGGTSQFALQNFGQAAGPAGKELISTMREMENRKDKLDEREFAVMDARNKFRQTGADSDLRSMQDSEKEYRGAKREYAKTDAQLQDSDVGRKYSLATAQAQEAGQNSRAVLSAKLQKLGLEIQAFNAATQRIAAQKPDEFTTLLKLREADPEFIKATPGEKVNFISSDIANAKKTTAGAEGYTLQAVNIKAVEDMFKDRTTPLGKMYVAIAENKRDILKQQGYTGKTGLAAANEFKDEFKNKELAKYGPRVTKSTLGAGAGAGVLQYDPTTGSIN